MEKVLAVVGGILGILALLLLLLFKVAQALAYIARVLYPYKSYTVEEYRKGGMRDDAL